LSQASGAVHRCVPLQIAFGSLRPLALSAQFLHAGADGGKVVSGTGSVHVSSSIGLVDLIGRVDCLEPPTKPIGIRLILQGKPRRHHRKSDGSALGSVLLINSLICCLIMPNNAE
jgi:hypothetical protein